MTPLTLCKKHGANAPCEPVEKRQALAQNHGFWAKMRPRQRTRKRARLGPFLCAFAGTRPAKSTDFILFCRRAAKLLRRASITFYATSFLKSGFFDNL
ncbi:MAG: hypothetical protein LUG64_04685, partial [Clostridiales bacterium]|nr:hypothetical protein [Clostridiales bacterium]